MWNDAVALPVSGDVVGLKCGSMWLLCGWGDVKEA